MKECPHCGSAAGYFKKCRVSGTTNYNYDFDGQANNNSEFCDCLNMKENKKKFCQECGKEIKNIW
jgi:predicted RNA-binding Zn-ribbon protein involved in translation (DUF1610 family)